MIKKVYQNWTIKAFNVPFEGKLHYVLVNFAQISTNKPLWINLNTYLFCYFLQVGFHLVKLS